LAYASRATAAMETRKIISKLIGVSAPD